MRVSILCSSHEHPIYPRLQAWMEGWRGQHEIELVERCADLYREGGDILFRISCHEIIPPEIRQRYRACLVVHASDLPKGRGWSPLVWQILEGKNVITVSLLEAADAVDSGAIWHKVQIHFEGHELCDEIHAALFDAELKLMAFALENMELVHPVPQQGEASYYLRRTPEDSRLDIRRSIADQFDLLRIADNAHYPAFFDFRGHRYQIILNKADDHAQ
jgi:methionyl-tRNA formyltransferase